MQFTTRLPVVLTVLAALTLGLSLLALVQPSRVYPALATAISFYIVGQFFPDGAALTRCGARFAIRFGLPSSGSAPGGVEPSDRTRAAARRDVGDL
jgi:hypothetical protein